MQTFPKKLFFLFVVFIILAIVVLVNKNNASHKTIVHQTIAPLPTTDEAFGIYNPPKIAKKDVSTIFMVGDSMTEELGPHGGKLNEFINELYHSTPGHQKIVIDNYAKGSTNLLGLQDWMNQQADVAGE